MKKRLPVIIAILLVVLLGLSACSDTVASLIGNSPEHHAVAVSRDKALTIALNHAGLQAEEVSLPMVVSDYEDGVPIYEVSFRQSYTEYEYEIHADTGVILSWDIGD